MKAFLKIFGALAIAALLMGAKIYKWTDENGQVHFTTSPPPENIQGDELSVSGQRKEKATLSGDWWTKRGNTPMRLSLGRSTFSFYEYPAGKSRKLHSKGRIETFDKRINFTYYSGPSALLDVTHSYVISKLTDDRLKLVKPNGETEIYWRKTNEAPFGYSPQLLGKWTNDQYPTQRLVIESDGFEVEQQRSGSRWRATQSGSWDHADGAFELFFVTDFSKRHELMGEKRRYKIIRVDHQQLVLQPEGQDQFETYSRAF